jgi:pimeloyl-ACP methyl ester carboxylesterase
MVADLRGQGHSSGARHGHGFQVHATDCLALLDLLGFERVVLVGQGYGAVVALLLAAWQPERAAGLVLLDEPATPPGSGPTQVPDRAEAIRGEAWWLRVAPPDLAAVHARVRCPTLRVQASDTAPVSRPMAQPAGAQTGTEGPPTPLAGDEAISEVSEFLAALDLARRSG